jgi:hypothetical protein
MTRTEVKTFIQSAINALNAGISYGGGRISEFDSERMHSYPKVWMEPMTTDTTLTALAPNDGWNIVLNIAKLDKPDSSSDQYEALVDECDLVAQELTFKMNNVVSGYDLVTIKNISRKPFIKENADCLTGIKLSFVISAMDQTDWC